MRRSPWMVLTAAAAVCLSAAGWAMAAFAATVPGAATGGRSVAAVAASPDPNGAPPAADPNGGAPAAGPNAAPAPAPPPPGAGPGAVSPAGDPNSQPARDPNAAPPAADANAPAQPPPLAPSRPGASGLKITRIVVDGNQRMSPEAVKHIMITKEGDPYDDDVLRKDFKRIWDQGLLSDLSIESREEKGGKAIIIHIVEKMVVNDVTYDDSKIIGDTQIEDALKERKATIEIGEPINYDRIKKAEEAIKGLLGQKGHLDAEVTAELKDSATPGSLDVRFKIKEGPRTRIRKIDFAGNTVFSDGHLRKSLKLTKQKGWFTRMSGKDTYHPIKLDQDLREVETLYQNDGYIDIELKPPEVKIVAETTSEKPGKSRKWVHITVPLVEGKQYRVGKIDVTGATVFEADQIRRRIPLRAGQVLNNGLLQLGLDAVEMDYSRKGYFYISTNRVIERKPDGVGDITIRVSEDKPYKIDRIEFSGNTVTRDNVLRRELQVNEEELLDIQKLRMGLRRINQLGFFEIQKEPVIKPVEGVDKVAVTIEGIEQRRSELQVGGGYSGLDGGFFTSSYQTRNFLGRGDLVTFNMQLGRIQTRYVISFTEPYFMGKPIILGFSIFRRSLEYPDFTSSGSGTTLTLGRRFLDFHSASVILGFEDTDYDPVTGVPSVTRTNSVRPYYTYDTRNNFFRPSRGLFATAAFEVAGGPLGGDNSFIKPYVEATKYAKAFKRTFWALHAQMAYAGSYGGTALPMYERFYLGGERSLRLFETRSVAPERWYRPDYYSEVFETAKECQAQPCTTWGCRHEPQANLCSLVVIGGNKMMMYNVEWIFPTQGPVDLALFVDAGQAFAEDESLSFRDMRRDAGVEVRFYLPVFGAPLRLIYGWNLSPTKTERTRSFVFSIGTTF